MQIHNPPPAPLSPDLTTLLTELRSRRGFDPAAYLSAKTDLVNRYLSQHGLRAVVVGTSGGIDSAVVLSLLAHAAAEPGSPIARIAPLLLPVQDRGATGQDDATDRASALCRQLGLVPSTADLTAAFGEAARAVEAALGVSGDAWARGQLVSYQRTPALYYATSVLTSAGLPALVAGTTNRDEGAYLGYFGKASDGMVDIQLISDLHKSEVYALARLLNVPAAILSATPSGDMFDGRVDEDVFGAPYDFVELHHLLLALGADGETLVADLPPAARAEYDTFAHRLEALHAYNHHKYLGRSPAVHLDVLDAAVPGGWNFSTWPQAA